MELKENLTRLKKVPVVAYEEGLLLGRVHDIHVDRRGKRIQGISFRNALWGKENTYYIDLAEILKIGQDVIIVSGQASASPVDEETAGSSLRRLKGSKITTHGGAYIGELVDLNVNRENGTISEIILANHQRLEVDVEDIILGPDVIMVPTDYIERITTLETEKNGLLQRMFEPIVAADTIRGKYKDIKASVSSSKHTEKVVETLRSGSEKTKKTVKRTSRKIQDALEQMGRKRENETGTTSRERPAFQGAEAEHTGRTTTDQGPAQTPASSHHDIPGTNADDDGRRNDTEKSGE